TLVVVRDRVRRVQRDERLQRRQRGREPAEEVLGEAQGQQAFGVVGPFVAEHAPKVEQVAVALGRRLWVAGTARQQQRARQAVLAVRREPRGEAERFERQSFGRRGVSAQQFGFGQTVEQVRTAAVARARAGEQ